MEAALEAVLRMGLTVSSKFELKAAEDRWSKIAKDDCHGEIEADLDSRTVSR